MVILVRYSFMCGSYVFDGLGNCLNHFWNSERPIHVYKLQKTGGQLGLINPSSTSNVIFEFIFFMPTELLF